ncbi:DUF6418 domain-containing protein [Selenomonas ruminantium]|uniref:DUF6418 domain-containing protein n=1 Tax=Selenomonas ruminantium TaxID=971 RepID=UPI0026F3439E|nr:DUF6418 domain-containing protein [Selenomonas ruminantium]
MNYIGVWIGGVIWVYYIVYTFITTPKFFFSMLLIIVPYTFAVLSEFVFELIPSFSPEMLIDTFLTGGLLRLVFYYLIFFMAAYIVFINTEKRTLLGSLNTYEKYIGYSLYFVVVVLMITAYYLYGIPVFNEMTRFEFLQGDAGEDPLIKFGRNQMPLCVVFFSLLYNEYSKKALLYIFIIIIILVLGSEKFTGILHVLILFATVYFFQRQVHFNRKIYFRILLGSIVFIFATGSLVYYHYTDLINNISIPVTDLLLMRFTEQGQVWWYVDNQMNMIDNIDHIEEFWREIKAWFQFRQDDYEVIHLGIYKMMEVIRGQEYVVSRVISGSRFTEGYPAVGLYYFGYVGLVFCQIILGGVYGVWAGKFYIAVRESDLISCLLYYKIWGGLNQAVAMGNFYELLRPALLLYLVMLYGISIWRKRKKNIEIL